MESNLKSYQSEYGNLTAEITANLSKITQNIRTETIPEDAIGELFFIKTWIRKTQKICIRFQIRKL